MELNYVLTITAGRLP